MPLWFCYNFISSTVISQILLGRFFQNLVRKFLGSKAPGVFFTFLILDPLGGGGQGGGGLVHLVMFQSFPHEHIYRPFWKFNLCWVMCLGPRKLLFSDRTKKLVGGLFLSGWGYKKKLIFIFSVNGMHASSLVYYNIYSHMWSLTKYLAIRICTGISRI